MVLDGCGLFGDFEGRAGRCSLPGLQVKLVAVPLERPHRWAPRIRTAASGLGRNFLGFSANLGKPFIGYDMNPWIIWIIWDLNGFDIHGRFATKTARTKCNGFGKSKELAPYEAIWGYVGPIWGYVGPMWAYLRLMLGLCWAYLDPFLAYIDPDQEFWPLLKNMQKHRILEQKCPPPQAKAY